jgi:hypothetical protein
MAANRARLLMYFRLENETMSEFAAELKKFSEEEKDALAAEVAAFLGQEF